MTTSIPWPAGPFAVRRASALPHALLKAAGLAVLAVLAAVQIHVLATQWSATEIRAVAASAGYGRADPALTVDWLDCRWRRRWEATHLRRYLCEAVVRDGAAAQRLVFQSAVGGLSAAEISAVRLSGTMALALPTRHLLTDILDFAATIASLLLLGGFAFAINRFLPWSPIRAIPPDARIISVDLLDRMMASRYSARWRFAYEHDGQRRYGRAMIAEPPILSCGAVTRGAALLMPDGRAHLLVRAFHPLDIAPERRAAAEAAAERLFHAVRPWPGRAFDTFLAGLDGPAAAYVAAWRDAWNGTDVPTVNAALERRHKAAAKLKPAEIDALQQRCRSFVPA